MSRLKREIWKTHPTFTDYEISDFGRVKRKTDGKKSDVRKGQIFKLGNRYGYPATTLTLPNGEQKSCFVHCLVLETFVGPRPKGHECNHKDGVKGNPRLSNLEWVTHSENQKHAHINKLQINPKGEECWYSKLKEGEVWLIKKLLSNKIPQTKIAKMFKICQSTVAEIKREKIWKHIKFQKEGI